MLVGPVTDSTSSGMCVRAIESDASMSSITFGLACAADVVTIGALSISVGAANENDEAVRESTKARSRTARRRSKKEDRTCFMMFSLSRRDSLQNDLGVADRVAYPGHLRCD